MYCLKTSSGFGPNMKNISITPDSDMKWASTWDFLDPDTKLTMLSTTLLSALDRISIQVSAVLCQKTPDDLSFLKYYTNFFV